MATALPGTGVPVSTDILTTLNGAAATAGEAIQRIKLSTGVPGVATDISAANPVPITVVNLVALAAETTKVIGTVTNGVGTAIMGALVANQSVNKAQINGVAPLMGNGISGAGSQRVNIASDNTAFAVNQGAAASTAWLANPLTTQITAEASSAKIVTGNSATAIINASATGVMLFLNASVVSGTTPSLTVKVQVQDPVSAGWVDLPGASYAAITAVTATPLLLIIDLSVVAVVNVSVNMPIPRTWRLAWAISGTTPSFTFSVGAQYLV